MKKIAMAILFISIIFTAGCTSNYSTAPETLENQQKSQSKDYNVIFIAFDGLQAKHLKSYGYNLNTAPNLEEFLGKSYLFKKAVSPSSWTLPTFMSVFTSMYPSEHKVVNKFVYNEQKQAVKANLKNLAPEAVTLAAILKRNGYATAGFTGDAGVSSPFGFNLGFDYYYDAEVFGGLDNSIPKALEWLKNNKDKKFFLFLHGYDVHGQHVPSNGFDYRYVKKPYNGKYTGSAEEQAALREEGLSKGSLDLSQEDVDFWRAVYDEKINKADEEFKQFMDEIEKLGLMDNTLFVVFSDHGTEFYEHKRFDHGHTLYSELVDVLFAIRLPKQSQGNAINSLVSTIDIVPTVLKILGIKNPVPQQAKGIDLTPSFEGKDVSRNIFSETDYRLYTHKRSVQTPDGWKLVITMETLEKELYNLNNDPGEQDNVIEKEPKIAYELEQLIYSHLNEMNANGHWDIGCLPVYNDQCRELTPKPQKNITLSKPNIILINIDSLRADHMGIYGYKKNTTPFLDSIFNKGIVFENAIAPAYLTFQTDAAILSGLYPSQNGITSWGMQLKKNIVLLPKILSYYNYSTAAIVSPSLWEDFEMNRHFDNYTMIIKHRTSEEGKTIVEDFASRPNQPFFIFWHIYDVHLPYMNATHEFYHDDYNGYFSNITWQGGFLNNTNTTFAYFKTIKIGDLMPDGKTITREDINYVTAMYDSGIKHTDNQLMQFFDSIKNKPFFNSTIFIISSEHGDDLAENGFIFHNDLYNTNIHVPLAFVHPSFTHQRISEPVSSLDVMPTVFGMINITSPHDAEGSDLRLLINGQSLNRSIFSERPPFDEYAVRKGKWKYILRNPDKNNRKVINLSRDDDFMIAIAKNDLSKGDELYDILADAYEHNNLVGRGLEAENDLRGEAIKFREKMSAVRNNSIKIGKTNLGILTYP